MKKESHHTNGWKVKSMELPEEINLKPHEIRYLWFHLAKAFQLTNQPNEFGKYLDGIPIYMNKTIDQLFDEFIKGLPKMEMRINANTPYEPNPETEENNETETEESE